MTPEKRQRLSSLTPNVPWMVIEGVIPTGRREPLGPPVAKVLRRPIRIGQIVDAVRTIIP
jgi:hypothetical protein